MKYITSIALTVFNLALFADAKCSTNKFEHLINTHFHDVSGNYENKFNTTFTPQYLGVDEVVFIRKCYNKRDHFPLKAKKGHETLYVQLNSENNVFKFYCKYPNDDDLLCTRTDAT